MTHSHAYEEIDRYAYTNPLSKTSPATKLFFAVSTLVICVSSPSPVVPVIAFGASTFLILYSARIPARVYLELLGYPTAMLAASCLIIALFFGYGEALVQINLPWFDWSISKNGLMLGATTFLRGEGALSCLFFLVLTTPITYIFVALRSAHVPAVLVEMSLLIYRYIFVLIEVVEKMRIAHELRSGRAGWLRRIRSLGLLSGNLFIRTLEQGERTLIAMNARGYDGKIRVLEELPKPKVATVIGVLIFDSALLLLSLNATSLLTS